MLSKIVIKRQLQFWRFVLPTLMFFLALYSVEEIKYSRSEFTGVMLWLSRMDPLLLIAHMRSAVVIPDWIGLPILVMVVTAFIGRFFCGWLCPMGGLFNLLYYIRRALFKGRLAKNTKLPLLFNQVKYVWLALVVFASIGTGILYVLTPLTLFSHEIARLYQGQIPWLMTVALLSSFAFFPRFWCTYVCPTGIFFTLLAGLRRVKMRATDKCVNCGHCKSVCPVNAIDLSNKGSGDTCLVCGRCFTACSQQAMNWTFWRQPSVSADDMLMRRKFLKLGAAITIGSLLNLSARRLVMASPLAVPSLRPPGAIPESDFLATCNRCSRCVKVCPTGGLVPMPFSSGLLSYETPTLIPRKGCCELCMLCSKVCPTGAIRSITVKEVKIGVARLDEHSCIAWTQDKACLICKERCPADAITIDDRKRPYINSQKCIGCGACENVCPVEGAAVKVVPNQ